MDKENENLQKEVQEIQNIYEQIDVSPEMEKNPVSLLEHPEQSLRKKASMI